MVGAVLIAGAAGGVWAWGPRRADPRPPGEPEGASLRAGPPDAAWCAAVGALPVDRQLAAVSAKLRELNPGYDGQVTRYGTHAGRINEFGLHTDAVTDLRPLRAFTGLVSLTAVGTEPGRGKLTDLGPLRGLPLTVLNVWRNPDLADLSPVRGAKLVLFQAGDTAVEDLAPLSGMPLHTLAVDNCRVRDLAPVRTMPRLNFVRCDGCPIASLEPLVGSTVRELTFTPDPARGDDAVLDRAKVKTVNRMNLRPGKE
ncbi:hypothetical protein [Frigoriglobus tundricola]|uniref:Leucine-rich repeat domain-containing protein n=1 Tax=Frigoriglobus tundricola TaxID=2774151 RepID=A0A6M5YUR5_9BACT|nr:hypothetical protein [Frigoriglobus tundricola]QJW96612.1 hypothetical protein FTUN_4169 [Frigoriglobus tundricola]